MEDSVKYSLDVHATAELPDFLKAATDNVMVDMAAHEDLGSAASSMTVTPSSMAQNVLTDATNAMRLYTQWHGPAPYGRLVVTQ